MVVGRFFFDVFLMVMAHRAASSRPSRGVRPKIALVDNLIDRAVSSSVQPAILSSSIFRSSAGRPLSHRFRLAAPKIRWVGSFERAGEADVVAIEVVAVELQNLDLADVPRVEDVLLAVAAGDLAGDVARAQAGVMNEQGRVDVAVVVPVEPAGGGDALGQPVLAQVLVKMPRDRVEDARPDLRLEGPAGAVDVHREPRAERARRHMAPAR